MYVCQYFVGQVDDESLDYNRLLHGGVDYTKFPKPHDARYRLTMAPTPI